MAYRTQVGRPDMAPINTGGLLSNARFATWIPPSVARVRYSISKRRTMLLRISFVHAIVAIAVLAAGQEAHPWAQREALGFKGPVKSVRTTIERPHPDPRPEGHRSLPVEGTPEWELFDAQGRRIEFGSAVSGDHIVSISKCRIESNAIQVCTDSTGAVSRARTEQTKLPDGSRETRYYNGSKLEERTVMRFDEKGRVLEARHYNSQGGLHSEDSNQFASNFETRTWKIYDPGGALAMHRVTEISEDPERVDDWEYDPQGQPVSHLAIDKDGALLSYWYRVGYKAKLSSSDSGSMCRPGLCVFYKFDAQGSGRLEKTVEYTRGEGNAEPDREEHCDFDGVLDEKAEIHYIRDNFGNWISRSVLVWDRHSNKMVEIERDTRKVEYY